MAPFDDWIGKSLTLSDSLAPEPLQHFEALFDRNPADTGNGTELPPCAHWIYFNPPVKSEELDESGNQKKGIFLPPVEQSQRMWAGGRLIFKKPLKAGQPADRTTTITKIDEKPGTSGNLCFVTLRHQISSAGAMAIDEEQDIVFREASEQGAHPVRSRLADIDYDWKKTRKFDSAHIFRYSALTHNSHKIHYDRLYAEEKEGYPNILIQAPLLLSLMINLFKTKTDGKVIEEISYRAEGPVYLHEEVTIICKTVDNTKVEMRALGPDNKIAMSASVKWVYRW